MTRNFYIANNKLLSHIVFWAAWVALNTVFLGSAEDAYMRQFVTELYELPEKLIVVYINLYVLIPRLLMQKKYYAYGFTLFAMLFGMALIMRAIYVIFLARQYYPDTASLPYFHLYRLFKYIFYNLNAVIFITTGIRLFTYWYQQQQMNNELVQEKLKAELLYLKGQLHPHFLFNTLNNLYSLSLQKSDLAPKMIMKLSELMNYMLYDSQQDHIDILKEIAYLKSYIELEKLRYGGRITVSFNQSGGLEGKQVVPLIMLPFVENAFKHGLSDDANDVWITIDIKVKQDVFYFKVRNSINGVGHIIKSKGSNGIGLQNIQRRLALLYPGRHLLEIRPDVDNFEIDLKINLV